MSLTILLVLTTLLTPGSAIDQVLAKSDVNSVLPSDVHRSNAQPALQNPLPVGTQASAEDWKTAENEVKLGKAFALQIEQSQKLVRDPLVTDYVSEITQKLARSCDASFPIAIKVIDADNINAVALPGGFLYVTSGLVSAAEDEAELAAALAHQMAHTCARQLIRGMSNQDFKNATTPPLVVIDPKSPPIFIGPVSVSAPPFTQNFPPKFELEADMLALRYMYQAGYDPGALLTFLSRLDAIEKTTPDLVSPAFATHLQTSARTQRARKNLRSFPRKSQYIVNSSDFDTAKAHLLILLAHRRRIT